MARSDLEAALLPTRSSAVRSDTGYESEMPDDLNDDTDLRATIGKPKKEHHGVYRFWNKLRKKAYFFMHPEKGAGKKYGRCFRIASWAFQGLIVMLIFCNVVLAVMDIDDTSSGPLQCLAIFTCLVFTFEFDVRLWTCIEANTERPCRARVEYLTQPLNALDFATIFLMWMCLLGNLVVKSRESTALRLGRLARLARLVTALGRLHNVDKIATKAVSRTSSQDTLKFYSSRESRWKNDSMLDDEDIDALLQLEEAIDTRDDTEFKDSERRCETLGISEDIINELKLEKKLESEQAGVSLAYLLSSEFAELAIQSTGKEDPTFIDMQGPFFLDGTRNIGKSLLCPRDLKLGCALIDSLPGIYRGKANCFLSWVWGYKLSVVQSGLKRWADLHRESPEDTYLYMCFFCNNQWRLLVEQSEEGTDNLEEVFETRLQQVGRVIALMDTWDNPLYTTRIWTIYEQYKAEKMHIKVYFTLPPEHSATLLDQLSKGKEGIMFVVQAVSKVDSEKARATREQDEVKVKEMIKHSTGFKRVNSTVRKRITGWVAIEFKSLIDELINEDDDELQDHRDHHRHSMRTAIENRRHEEVRFTTTSAASDVRRTTHNRSSTGSSTGGRIIQGRI